MLQYKTAQKGLDFTDDACVKDRWFLQNELVITRLKKAMSDLMEEHETPKGQ